MNFWIGFALHLFNDINWFDSTRTGRNLGQTSNKYDVFGLSFMIPRFHKRVKNAHNHKRVHIIFE